MNFDKYAQEANGFLRKLSKELNNGGDTLQASRITRSVFHTFRDLITPEESMHLIAQLPMYLKALYVDGWNMHAQRKIHTMNDFLYYLREKDKDGAAKDFLSDEDAKNHVQSVFKVLHDYMSTGEMIHIMDQLPAEIVSLFNPLTLTE